MPWRPHTGPFPGAASSLAPVQGVEVGRVCWVLAAACLETGSCLHPPFPKVTFSHPPSSSCQGQVGPLAGPSLLVNTCPYAALLEASGLRGMSLN